MRFYTMYNYFNIQMDAMVRVRNLQIALQDRCKDHFKQLRKYTNKLNSDNMIENNEIIN